MFSIIFAFNFGISKERLVFRIKTHTRYNNKFIAITRMSFYILLSDL